MSALDDFRAMVRAMGPGYHPDTDPHDYTGYADGYDGDRVEAIEAAAFTAGVDPYGEAAAIHVPTCEAETCEDPDHDHYTTVRPDGTDSPTPVPATCGDCHRPTFWDEKAGQYRHAIDPTRGCFLIPAAERVNR